MRVEGVGFRVWRLTASLCTRAARLRAALMHPGIYMYMSASDALYVCLICLPYMCTRAARLRAA